METTQPVVDALHAWIEWGAFGIELLAVVIIIASVVRMTISTRTIRYLMSQANDAGVERSKTNLGKSLLLALELLVAADVVRTVTAAPTLENVAVLGILVLVRTILSWSLIVEMDGRWPWQAAAAAESSARASVPAPEKRL